MLLIINLLKKLLGKIRCLMLLVSMALTLIFLSFQQTPLFHPHDRVITIDRRGREGKTYIIDSVDHTVKDRRELTIILFGKKIVDQKEDIYYWGHNEIDRIEK